MFTIEPPLSRSTGSACLQASHVPVRLTATLRTKASTVSSVAGASPSARLAPTLLCRMSSRPRRSWATATSRRTASSSVTSASTAHARPPSFAIRSTVSWAESRRRSATTTRAPSRASTSAVARPLPNVPPGVCPPPTTIAVLPSTRPRPLTWGPRPGPPAPRRSERPGKAGAPLFPLAGTSAAAAGGRAIRPPAPRPGPEVRREDAALLDGQSRRERAIDAQRRAEDVVDHPGAVLQIEHGDVGLATDGQAAQARLGADGLGRVRGRHRDHLRQREAEAEEARHHLGHAVHGHLAPGHREIRADAVREQALVDDAPADVEAEVHAAVGGVEPHPAIRRLARLRHQLAVAVEHAAGIGREVVGEDVTGLEQGEQRVDHLRVVALLGVAGVAQPL